MAGARRLHPALSQRVHLGDMRARHLIMYDHGIREHFIVLASGSQSISWQLWSWMGIQVLLGVLCPGITIAELRDRL